MRACDDAVPQEVAGMGFWLPGGGLDQGETLRAGAVRETLEEAGVHVTLTSLLQVMHACMHGEVGGGERAR